jgi:hypothetical protein
VIYIKSVNRLTSSETKAPCENSGAILHPKGFLGAKRGEDYRVPNLVNTADDIIHPI